MSEEILAALTQLFAIISKQDGGVTDVERNFVIGFFQQNLDTETVNKYVDSFDKQSKEEGEQKKTRVNDSVKVLGICKKINKTLVQKQKVIVLFNLLEMVSSDSNLSPQRMDIVKTVADVFNIPSAEYKLAEAFATRPNVHDPSLDSEDILIFDNEPAVNPKAKYIDSGLLDGEIIFIRIKSVGLYFIRYTGIDEVFLNGKFVKKDSLLLFSNGSIIKTPMGSPLYYSDLVNRYNSDVTRENISFNVDDLEFKFPNGAIGLRNVNLSENSGKLIGIMGASGAGKTTLLNVLAGLEKPSKGSVKINGFNIHDPKETDHIEGVIGYIAQDDLLIEELSVFQNLFYNAKLCFRDSNDVQLTEKVMEVLVSLGLDKIKDLKVGNVLNKKISGGQRKRLNIALELIREPSILFVDEPTSGLSSKDSENVIDLLKELSLKNKLIFVVIHQPSSDIYKMFDKMWLMDTGGYPVFYGDPIEAVIYFRKAAKQAEQQINFAYVNPEQIFNIIESRVVDEYGEFLNKRKVTPPEWHELYKQNFKIERHPDFEEEPPKNLKIPSKVKQTSIFTTRDLLSKISNTQYMIINLLEAPFLAMLMALIIRYKDTINGETYIFRYNDNIPAYILISIIVALFMGLSVSAEEIIRDRKIKKREAFLNLSNLSYLSSKVIILFSLSAVQMFTFVIIGSYILDIRDMNFTYWLVLFSVSCFANVLGLNISSSFDSAVTVYILIPLLLIPQMILSGAIFRFEKLNDTISEKGKVPLIADMWVSRWAYEAITVEQFKNNPFEKLFFNLETEESVANYKVSFWLPELDRKLDKCLNYKKEFDKKPSDSLSTLIVYELDLIKNELKSDEYRKNLKSLNLNENFKLEAFTPEVVEEVKAYFEEVKEFYNNKNNNSTDKQDIIKGKYPADSLAMLKNQYFNESLEEVVKNINVKEKITSDVGRLVQLSDPIFLKPTRFNHLLDYRSHFYAPKKHLFGYYFNTYYFNVLVIWLFTVSFFITLYFDLLSKAVHAMGSVDYGAFFDKINFVKKMGLAEKLSAFFNKLNLKGKWTAFKTKFKKKQAE